MTTRRRGLAGLSLLGVVLLALVALAATGSGARHETPGTATAAPAPRADYPVPAGAVFVATHGDDAAPGTEARPLRTVAAAVRRAPAGGTVVIRGGTYRETVGTVREPVTIQPYPGERVWLKGTVVVSGWHHTPHGWRHDGWTVALCHTCYTKDIIDPEHPYAGLPDMVFVDGSPLRQVAAATDVTTGTFYVDTAGDTLLLGDDPRDAVVEASAFDHLVQFDPGAEGSVMRGVGVSGYASNQDYGHHGAMVIVNAGHVRLENDTFAWSASAGAEIVKPGAEIRGSTFVDNGLVGLVANRADDIELTGNAFRANNQEHFALSGSAIGAAGAKVTRTKRAVVTDNTFTGNIGSGWWCDLGCTDATVLRNVATGNIGNGLYYEVSSRALIASNVSAGNHGHGLKISSSDHVLVYNNTLADNGVDIGLYNDERSPDFDAYSERLGLSWITAGTVLVNNMTTERSASHPIVVAAGYKDPPPRPAFVAHSDGNAYLRHDGSSHATLITWSLGSGDFTRYDTLAGLTAATGQEQHGIAGGLAGSPFVDPDAGDYHLRESAPGTDAGQPLPDKVASAIGVHPSRHPDIGALRGPDR